MSFKSLKERIKESAVYKILKNKYFIATAAFLVWIVFIDSNNVLSWIRYLGELSAQERQKEYYKEAIQRTDEQLKELSSNRDSLEKFAREQYFFHKPDEEVFIIKE